MKKSEAKRKIQEIRNAQEVDNFASNLHRARSVTVGTCFGGTTEIMMRGEGGKHLWCAMQPAVAPLILLTLLCVRFSL